MLCNVFILSLHNAQHMRNQKEVDKNALDFLFFLFTTIYFLFFLLAITVVSCPCRILNLYSIIYSHLHHIEILLQTF